MDRKTIRELERLRTSVTAADRVKFGQVMVRHFNHVPSDFRKKLSFDNLAWVYHESCQQAWDATDHKQWKKVRRYAIIVNDVLQAMRVKARHSKRYSLTF